MKTKSNMTVKKPKELDWEKKLSGVVKYCPKCNVPSSDKKATTCAMCYSKLKSIYE